MTVSYGDLKPFNPGKRMPELDVSDEFINGMISFNGIACYTLNLWKK